MTRAIKKDFQIVKPWKEWTRAAIKERSCHRDRSTTSCQKKEVRDLRVFDAASHAGEGGDSHIYEHEGKSRGGKNLAGRGEADDVVGKKSISSISDA